MVVLGSRGSRIPLESRCWGPTSWGLAAKMTKGNTAKSRSDDQSRAESQQISFQNWGGRRKRKIKEFAKLKYSSLPGILQDPNGRDPGGGARFWDGGDRDHLMR